MNKKTLALAGIVGLLLLALTGIFSVNDVAANFIPEQPPAGIEISGGSVKGTDLIERVNDRTYILKGNLDQTIVILDENVVLDGNGYTLEGNGTGTGVGVFLQAKTGITIKNLQITGFSYGLKSTWYFYGSDSNLKGNTVSNCTFTGNTYGIYIGDFSSGNKLTGNTLTGNTYGIYLAACSNSYLRDNHMNGNTFNFFVSGGTIATSVNDIDESNNVNGKPIIYWQNKQSQTVPANAGYIALVNCTKMTIQDMDLSHNGQAILLAGVTDSTIQNNKITQNHNGIWLVDSENNRIEQNIFSENSYYAIYASNSERNSFVSNSFTGNGLKGTSHEQAVGSTGKAALYLVMSHSNQIENNQISGNGEGISFHGSNKNTIKGNILENTKGSTVILFSCENNTVTANTINANEGPGVKLWSTQQTNVFDNDITGNSLGILLDGATENNIHHNNIEGNTGFGMQLKSASFYSGASTNNTITQNKFIDNQPDGIDVSIPGIYDWTHEGPQYEMVAGPGNTWEANYWSDYYDRYPNASEVGNTGVGNTPYVINENNIDYKPKLAPNQIPTQTQPPQNTQTPAATQTTDTQQNHSDADSPLNVQLIVIIAVVSVLAVTGLLFYSKKQKDKTQNTPS
ncbi:MAG: nitrous oxide reductase family maturation protein NosD [Candidatus Bathyarchaeia archaeon]|jgi:parallel beta-helix repeat protein